MNRCIRRFALYFASTILAGLALTAPTFSQDTFCSPDQRNWEVLSAWNYDSPSSGDQPTQPDNSVLGLDGELTRPPYTRRPEVQRLGFHLDREWFNRFDNQDEVGLAGRPFIPLCAFARQTDLIALRADMSALSSDVTALWAFAADNRSALERFQQLGLVIERQTDLNRDGVAMAFAMSGIGSLAPNENGSFSGNIGSFDGATGFAMGGSTRVTDRLSISAAFAYAEDSDIVGGRAGFRVSW
jgi:YadA-like membrane anchor domain